MGVIRAEKYCLLECKVLFWVGQFAYQSLNSLLSKNCGSQRTVSLWAKGLFNLMMSKHHAMQKIKKIQCIMLLDLTFASVTLHQVTFSSLVSLLQLLCFLVLHSRYSYQILYISVFNGSSHYPLVILITLHSPANLAESYDFMSLVQISLLNF